MSDEAQSLLLEAGTQTCGSAPEVPRLRVAVIDEELPYPLDSGKRIRTFELIRRLASRHEVTLVAHESPDARRGAEARAALRDAGIETRLVPNVVARKQGAAFYARLLANLASPRPYSVDSNCTPSLRAAVAELAREPFDLLHFEWTPLAAMADAGCHQPSVVVAHNIETLIWQRYRSLERNPLKRIYIAEQARKFERFERQVLQSADRVVTVSEPDAKLARQFGAQNPVVVDNGVDVSRFAYRRPEFAGNQLLFLGSLDWRPNQDAVAWLLDAIWPAVRARRPAVRLSIVGRRPPLWLIERCRQTDGVELAADVPDVRPYLESATALIVPLRIGGGSRLKILEALAAGLPCISTTVGAEGLHVQADEHLLLADESEAFVGATLQLLSDADLQERLSLQGRLLVEQRYDWNHLADKLELVWLETARCRRS